MADRPFNERLRDALASGSSAIVAATIGEAQQISADAAKAAEDAKARALDPLLADAEIEAARKAASDAEFTMQRMAEAVRVLGEKREEFRKAEDQAERGRVYAAALQVRNDAAARLAAEYPDLANRLGGLLADVVAADAAVEAANRNLPIGKARIEGVEMTARPGFLPHLNQPALTRMTIPSFNAQSVDPTWGEGRTGATAGRAFRPNRIGSGPASVNRGEAA
ncbi:hypothetical protein [Jiella sonneratiae]|uniref:Uncharacterized protein n=1 Tax=Jiella sonneratiae TaxID=2816856 RepID=A0ABS3JA60_9HYPH|nr:hypothetical protein [Jiella sonneratiae]MBO0906530.1 hypothetical protein [Jiella sonneratiae]